MSVIYLTKEQLILLHSITIDETGGAHGVRDLDAVLSLEQLPKQKAFGKELYQNVFMKTAIYARAIIMNHPFIDGNKRTGMIAAFVFLERNGYVSTAREGEIKEFALKIIKERYSIEVIADWFKKHVKKIK